MTEIIHRHTRDVLYRDEYADNVRAAVIAAVVAGADLAGADLAGADLSDADLTGADLTGARLRCATLTDTYLVRANFTGANLTGANFTDAKLSGANLSGANVTGATLTGADFAIATLRGANFADASLAPIRDDVRCVLDAAPLEVAALLAAVREGRIEGSVYEGTCSCLVGTIAATRGVHFREVIGLDPDSGRPAERFVLGIKRGDTPQTNPISAVLESWIAEWVSER